MRQGFMNDQANTHHWRGDETPVVVPAVLPRRWEDVASAARAIAGAAPRLQVDVVDGVCGKETTWPILGGEHWDLLAREEEGLPSWKALDYEVDLIVRREILEEWARGWTRAGAASIIFHPYCAGGAVESLVPLIEEVKEQGLEIGIGVRPSEDVGAYAPLFARADFVQIMGNDIVGAQGLPLMLSEACAQCARVREAFSGPIGIDIGVNRDTLKRLAACGFCRFAVGSSILKADDPKNAYKELAVLARERLGG